MWDAPTGEKKMNAMVDRRNNCKTKVLEQVKRNSIQDTCHMGGPQ